MEPVTYEEFLQRKMPEPVYEGIETVPTLNKSMFPHQRDCTEFAIRVGRSAQFLDTGLGKTFCQLEWSRVVVEHTGKPVLVLAPLAVAHQTKREADRFGIDAEVVQRREQMGGPRVYVTNYERLSHFDPKVFGGVVLDESSILKSFTGRTRNALVEAFSNTPFRLCCTATPSPNDHMELGNHAEFLGHLDMMDMLHRFFVNDTSEASQKWRLKGHGVGPFWDWVSSWARCVSMPSDLGYSDEGFHLPRLNLHHHLVDVDVAEGRQGMLFRMPNLSSTGLHAERRRTAADRAEKVVDLVTSESTESWVIWCETDYEADEVRKRMDVTEVKGSMTTDAKERNLLAFSNGDARVLLTKPSIAGFGLNWQHCARQAYLGIGYSYESFYQAVRRCWRFGQKRPVDVHVVLAETEAPVWDVISRKHDDHDDMKREMLAATRRSVSRDHRPRVNYTPQTEGTLPEWMRRIA